MEYLNSNLVSLKQALKSAEKNNNGLLSYIEPLFRELASIHADHNKSLTVDQLYWCYICMFINHAPVMVACFDQDMKFQSVSKTWDVWFKSMIKKKHSSDLNTLSHHSVKDPLLNCPKALISNIRKTLKGKSAKSEGLKLKSPLSRQERWVRFESFPIYNQNQSVRGCIVFCEDITIRKKLAESRKCLHNINEMLQNFSLIFSHDLIQPLRQISNYLEILTSHLKKEGKIDDSSRALLGAIESAIVQGRELCEGIIFYCKQGKLTANKEVIDFQEVIDLMTERCFVGTKIRFQNKIDKSIKLHMNRACVLQLFQNLLANAAKHSPKNNPLVILSGKVLDSGMFQFNLHNEGSCPEHLDQDKLFDAFESSKEDGAGLGLMICKKIVTSYGGTIHFYSSPKKGTSLVFTLPYLQ